MINQRGGNLKCKYQHKCDSRIIVGTTTTTLCIPYMTKESLGFIIVVISQTLLI